MYHPSRGGVRGGSDQFEWESVKADKHRENYLGHSLMAPVGRWQKKKDLQWFSRDKKGSADKSKQEEKDAIKRMEAEAMATALGKGPVKKVQTQQLTRQELEEVFKKGQTERDDKDIERVEGMGFGSTRASLMDNLSSNTKETMSATGSNQDVPSSAKQNKEKIGTAPVSIPREERKTKTNKKKEKKEKRKHKKKKSKVRSESSRKHRRHDSESDLEDQNSLRKHQLHDSDSNDDRRENKTTKVRTSKPDDNQLRESYRKERNDSDDDDWPRKKTRKGNKGGEGKYSSKRHDSSDDSDHPRKNERKNDERGEGKYLSRKRHNSYDDNDHPRKNRRKDFQGGEGKYSSWKRQDSSSDEGSRENHHRDSVRKKRSKQTSRHDSSSEDNSSQRKVDKKASTQRKRHDYD